MASLDQVIHFYPTRKNSDSEKEIRDWIERHQDEETIINPAIDLFDFSKTGRGFIAKT